MTILRTTILLACCVPILAGLAGCLEGSAFLGSPGSPAADSHFRYLSGLLLGIGIGFFWASLELERRAWAFDILAPIVILGGLSRLIGLVLAGPPPLPHLLALGMELGVTPVLWLWVRRAVPVRRLRLPS